MIVVADTSPLLHLARIGRLSIVHQALGPVIVPRTVWCELVEAGTRPDVVRALRAASWIAVHDDPAHHDLGLDPGETAAILLAEALGADALLIDERRGRAVANARGLAVLGTLGVLAAAKRNGAVDRVAPIVEDLRRDGFWLADELVAAFLARVAERP
jgi:predicted nucleic acid-binding protein